jgi:hypothetical protein
MGSLQSLENITHVLSNKAAEYDIFVETGCGWGGSLDFASQFPFKKLFSVEVVEEAYLKCKERFVGREDRIIIDNDESGGFLNRILPGLADSRIIFWLDAHWPGLDCRIAHRDSNNERIALPLRRELQAIFTWRKKLKDIILIDDLRIYEDGKFQSGNLRPTQVPILPRDRTTKFIENLFKETHEITRFSQDDGYVTLVPREILE